MMQLSALLWGMAFLFGYIGFSRGWNKEVIAMSGIVLGLFALFQFDDVIRGTLLVNVPAVQAFFIQTALFAIIVLFAYQTRALIGQDAARARGEGNREQLQSNLLGGVVGFVNGYLIWGSIWYFLDINEYPLAPYVVAPAVGSPSAAAGSRPVALPESHRRGRAQR